MAEKDALERTYPPIGSHAALPGGLAEYQAMYERSINEDTADEFWDSEAAKKIY